MRNGPRNRRITLLRRTVAARDANASAAQTFASYATPWAEKIDAGGREYTAAQQERAEIATRFKIRYRADVAATDRITSDGLSYDITHIQEIGRREELMLFATATRT